LGRGENAVFLTRPDGESWTFETFTDGANTSAVWSEVSLGDLSTTGRLDAEHYRPIFIDNVQLLKTRVKHPVETFDNVLTSISGGATPLGADYPDHGIPFLRVQNIMPGYLNLDNVAYISEQVHHTLLSRSQLRVNDVLLTITGVSYGKAAYVPDGIGEANINQHSVRMHFTPNLLPEYVATFLNSRFGKLQTDMKITGVTRPALDYHEIGGILIPVLPIHEQQSIQQVLKQAEAIRRQAQRLYADAETILLHELGLDQVDLASELTYEMGFDQMMRAGRFDAEYYHPEKTHVLAQLERVPGETLDTYFHSVRQLVNPPNKYTEETVRNYDLTDALSYFLDDQLDPIPLHELGSTKKRIANGDIVVSRLRSYLKEIALVTGCNEIPCVGSSEFIVLRPISRQVKPEALLVYLRSPIVQKIVKWSQNGSNHPRFEENELLKIKVPDTLLVIQDTLKDIVIEMLSLKRESTRLLEEAKQSVEQMILEGA